MAHFKRPATLEPGVYEATLKSIKETLRKAYQSEDMEEVLEFTYLVTDHEGSDQIVKRSVTPVIASRSNLLKDLRGMMGAKALEAVQSMDEALWDSMQNLVGKTFLLQTDLSASGYCKILSVMAKPQGKQGATAKPIKPKEAIIETSGEDEDLDNIPF